MQTLSAVSEGTGFGAQVAQAARQGASGLTAVVRGIILLAVTLWPLLALMALAGIVLWVVMRRRKTAAQAQQQSMTPPDDQNK